MAENNVFLLESGAALLVTMSDFESCKELHDEIVKTFLAVGGTEKDLTNVEMLPLLLTAGANKAVERALFKCAESAVYRHDGTEVSSAKVNKTLFDMPVVGEKARADYYPIFLKIAEVNLAPFMQALFSALKTLQKKNTNSPK